MDAHNAKQTFQRLMAAHGVGMVLLGCVWGLLPRPTSNRAGFGGGGGGGGNAMLIHSDRAFLAAHHQMMHQGELTLALALVFPLLRLTRPSALRALFWATLAGMWANLLAYVVMAVTGQGTDLAPNTSAGTSRGSWSMVETGLFVSTAVCDVGAFSAWLYGLIAAGG
jgi:hypothetical protein